VIEVKDEGTEEWFVEPGEFGLGKAPVEEIAGGEPAQNAEVIRSVLGGVTGAARDVVLLNAGAAIYVGGKANDLAAGVNQARNVIDSGGASSLLLELVESTKAMSV